MFHGSRNDHTEHPKSVQITPHTPNTPTHPHITLAAIQWAPSDSFATTSKTQKNTCARARSDPHIARIYNARNQKIVARHINMDPMLNSDLVPSWSLSTLDVVRQRLRGAFTPSVSGCIRSSDIRPQTSAEEHKLNYRFHWRIFVKDLFRSRFR